jgi:hypothetical protein
VGSREVAWFGELIKTPFLKRGGVFLCFSRKDVSMPSFAAHLIIAQEVLASLKDREIEGVKNYFFLGSLGPDLPYYRNVFGTAIGTFFEEKYNPESPGYYSGYGDYFHSKTPNLFPMKMLEIIKKDRDPATEKPKLAFAFGFLTHIAADQHIHPLVENYAGPFYSSGLSRKRHRTLEVYQDLFLFQNKFPNKFFFEEDFSSWINVGPPSKELEKEVSRGPDERIGEEVFVSKEFSFEWLRSFISRAFFEAFSQIMEGAEVEEWIKGFNSILGYMKGVGPYRDAIQSISKTGKDSNFFREMFDAEDKNYLTKYFQPAKEISVKYILAAKAFMNEPQITDDQRKIFLSQVPEADLTTPLMAIWKAGKADGQKTGPKRNRKL